MLDHGCGEALDAGRVAAACGKLYLCEAAPSVREKLRAGENLPAEFTRPEVAEVLRAAYADRA